MISKLFTTILFPLIALMSPLTSVASHTPNNPENATEETATVTVPKSTAGISGSPLSDTDGFDLDIRLNPVIIPDEATDIDIPVPYFINTAYNHIIYNGSDWSKLRKAFEESSLNPVSIVHIGDSHIQADFSTGITRELLQYDFGNAGRGLIAPLKISGTNEPRDYLFQSKNSWDPVKLMSAKWDHTVGFTGTSIRPINSSSEFTFGTSDADDYNPFKSATIFHNGKLTIKGIFTPEGNPLQYRTIPSRDYTQIILDSAATKINVKFASAGDLTVFGASLSGDRPGVFYHAIGNNGATFDTYNRIGTVGAGISPLQPHLIILSLGTNEAFGKFNSQDFARSIDRLVKNVKAANPEALILLTTPMECQRSVTTSKKVRAKGKKRRYRTVTSKSYVVNKNIAPVRQAILNYAKSNSLPVYDWYEVAGGNGASANWITNGLFAKDRVHHTQKGYTIEGRLFYDAIMDALREQVK
ncbi:MAG: GDSL-type esterase/lipase family protein [Duncaniella sp.]|nr:GDSL-type esterase/lipase family protein [Duncaniella sp.]